MTLTNYTIIPSDTVVIIDGNVASGVSMTGIPATVQAIQWYGLQDAGTIQYYVDPETGVLPNPGSFTNPANYSTQTSQAEAIINAYQNPVTYYYNSTLSGFQLGTSVTVSTVGWPQPPYTTTLVPPAVPTGQTLWWYDSAWVVASFDPSLSLSSAKTSLISTTTQNGSSAVNTELGLYSNVQQITAASVLTLDCVTYPGTTIGDYQTYVDGLIASSTATINAASSTTALYSFNPAEVPFTPTASGTISGSRTGNDFNDSYYVTFVSDTLIEGDTELFIPATSTVIPYVLPTQFAATSEAFGGGDYRVQIRQSSTGFVLAEYICPAGPPDVVVAF